MLGIYYNIRNIIFAFHERTKTFFFALVQYMGKYLLLIHYVLLYYNSGGDKKGFWSFLWAVKYYTYQAGLIFTYIMNYGANK